jgi:hypothetical protein
MSTDLTLDLVQSQLKPKQRLLVGQETIEEINKLANDPDYGEEFLDVYLDHLNILKENTRRSHDQYLSAVKFFSLVEAENSLTDAYIKTFPDRFHARKKNQEGFDKSIMRGEASRYNASQMVSEIRRVATIPVQLIHRHTLHEAIMVQAELMRTGKSEFVRQKASAVLIAELKPTEDATLNIKVEDGSTSVIEELQKAAQALAMQQRDSVATGTPIKTISAARIQEQGDIVDGEFEDV